MRVRELRAADWDEVAGLIHGALSAWYRRNLNSERFGSESAGFRVFPELYEGLDSGCALVAEGEGGGLLGVVFYHPRETHVGVGIVATHPDHGGRGLAKRLMREVLARAGGVPVRLVSSAMNLDSFSLYTKLGFVPVAAYQDMVLDVPAVGLGEPESGVEVRRAEPGDVAGMVALEERLAGIRREKDWRHLVENAAGCWRAWVAVGDGELCGVLGAVTHEHLRMVGPGVALDEDAAGDLLQRVLNEEFRGREALWLAPVSCGRLVARCYGWGARNVELHLASVRGEAVAAGGVVCPTFMPESG